MLETGHAPTRHLPAWLARPASPWRLINLTLLGAAVAAGVTGYFVAGHEPTAAAQVTTGTVQRGSVLSTVSASGNVQPAQTLSLNFSGSGTITNVYVKAGQRVRKGQPLAKLDDTSQAADVRTARANLASAQANLKSLQDPLTPATRKQNQVAAAQAQAGIATQQTALRDAIAAANQDRRTLEKAVGQAKASLAQTQKVAAANERSLRNAVGEAKGAWLEAKAAASRDGTNLQTTIDQAKAQLQRDQEQLQRDQAELASDQNDVSTYTSQVNSTTSTVNSLQSQVDSDKARVADDQKKEHSDKCDQTPPPQPKCANDAYRTSQDQSTLSDDQSKLSQAQSDQNTAQSKLDAATSAVKTDQTAIVNDQTKIATDQEAITTAENNVSSGQVKDAQSVNQAYRSYVNAKQALTSGLATNKQSIQNAQKSVKDATASLKAGAIKDEQSVHTARASLKTAKQTLESTKASNAQKAEPATAGELASARAQITTAQTALENALAAQKQMTLVAPTAGTVASISSHVGESPGGAASGSSDTSTAFISLVDLEGPQVTASFSETDAAKIKPGQAATITVDALPNKLLAAHVVSVDTTQTVVSNVVTYGVTLVLDRTTPALKPGMTVSAAVIVSKRDGVLHIPNAAVRTAGGSSTVTVVDAKGVQSQRSVTTGIVGDDATEIVSGLKEGDKVVVSSAAATGLTGTTGLGGSRSGGLGGGRTPQVFVGP
jgi:RND family efflux transporter MFP subunit